MKKIIYNFIIFTLSIVYLQAQNTYSPFNRKKGIIDSLKIELKKANEDSIKLIILNNLCDNYLFIDINEALNYGQLALKFAKKSNDRNEKAITHVNLGHAYILKSDYARSLDYFYKALKIFEELDAKKQISEIYNDIGVVYIYTKNYKKALQYYKKALQLNLKHKKNLTTSRLLNDIGDVYLQTKDYKNALTYFYKSLKINTELNFFEDIRLNKTNIGICYVNLKEYSKGIAIINESLEKSKNSPSFFSAFSLFELGRTYYVIALDKFYQKDKKKHLRESIFYLEKALILWQENESSLDIQESYFYLSKANKELGNYKLALDQFEKYTEVKSSIFSEDNKHKIANLEAQREIDLRDKKIEIQNLKIESEVRKVYSLIAIALTVAAFMALFLWMYLSKRKTNRLLNEKNKMISAANHQKDKFFSIIAHDLRDPFNGFLGLTELLAEDLDTMSPDEIKFAAVNMRSSATNLFRLLENLLEWSRMEQGLISFTPQENNLQTVVSECIVPLNANANTKEIKIYNNIPENTIAYADKNSLHAVIRNVLSNAVKFTPMGGEITIKAEEDKNNMTISISDSGIGMNAEMVKNLFRLDAKTNRTGTNNEPSTGLGLILCKEFVEKHGGKIWVESEERKGTTFYFSFPKQVP